jgi:hypothetical protein
MKKIVLASFLFLPCLGLGSTLVCKPEPYTNNYGAGVYDKIEASCLDEKSQNKLDIKISGYGISARLASLQVFTLICPLRDVSEVIGTYYGVKLEAEVAVGLKGGLFYSKNKACILSGVQAGGVGFAVTGSKLEITSRY